MTRRHPTRRIQPVRKRRIAVVRHAGYPADVLLARNLPALRDAGFDVTLICDREKGQRIYERTESITVLRLPLRHRRGGMLRYLFEYSVFPLLATIVLGVLSLLKRFDYVEIDTMPDWLISAAIVPRALGARVCLYTFENMPELIASDRSLARTHPVVLLFLIIERLAAKLAHDVIAPSQLIRDILIRQGIPADKITVVTNGPDERLFQARAGDPLRDPNAFRLVTHGSLLHRYGIQTLLQAMPAIRACIPAVQLDIFGDGEYRPDLEAQATRLGLGDCVAFHGYVPFTTVPPLLARADLGLVPMWADHLLPHKLMEYLALGLPAISSDWPAVRHYLQDDAVLYVEPKNPDALAESVVALYHDTERRAALGARGHEVFLEKLSWHQVKWQYLAVYHARQEDPLVAPEFDPMKWLRFVLGQSRGRRNSLARLTTIWRRFGFTARRSEANLHIIMAIMERYGARPTFAVTAVTARRHPELIRNLVRRGAELAAHGYVHNDFASLGAAEQTRQIRAARDVLAGLGLPVMGWRSPYFRRNRYLLPALSANGFTYDSTSVYFWPVYEEEGIILSAEARTDYQRLRMLFSARDARDHVVLPTMVDGLVEIPAALPQDEDMVDRLHLDPATMTRVWLRALHDVHERGELLVINLHPERAALCAQPLEELLAAARRREDVWIATLSEVSAWWRARDCAEVGFTETSAGWELNVDGGDRLVLTGNGQISTAQQPFVFRGTAKPVVQTEPAWPPATHQRLRDAGYLTENESRVSPSLVLDGALPATSEPDAVVRFVRDRADRLVRLEPWPRGYRSCLCISGDIDALTLIDFALRLKEF